MLKIALVVDQPSFSGIGRYALELSKGLRNANISATLIRQTVQEDNSDSQNKVRLRAGVPSPKVPLLMRKNRNKLIESRVLDDFDIIHFIGSNYEMSKSYHNVICTIHEFYFSLPHRFSDLLKKSTLVDTYYNYSILKLYRRIHSFPKIVVPSQHVQKDILNKCNVNAEVIYHWVDKTLFKKRDKEASRSKLGLDLKYKYVLNVSQQGFNKNQQTILRVANLLPRNFKILHIGNQLKHKNIININQVQDDLYPEYFNAADVYIHTSTNEGFGFPLLESIASGLPVISNTLGTSKEVLGNTGIYVSRALNARDYAREIMDLISKEPYLDVERKILNRSYYFSEESSIKKYKYLYSDFLGGADELA